MYNVTPRILESYPWSHSGNHLSVLIPVFYALKYSKFTTITFTLNDIFTQVTIATKISGTQNEGT